MSTLLRTIRTPVACIVFSLLVHTLPVIALRLFGTFNFGAPVNQPAAVMVSLGERPTSAPAAASADAPQRRELPHAAKQAADTQTALQAQEKPGSTLPGGPQQPKTSTTATLTAPGVTGTEPIAPQQHQVSPEASGSSGRAPRKAAAAEPGTTAAVEPGTAASAEPGTAAAVEPGKAAAAAPGKGAADRASRQSADGARRLKSSDFLAQQHEKLTYQVSMHGIPIGSAELEASNENGVTTITLRVKSNAAISAVFPVDDLVETRHLDGRFIMTKIRQQEGTFRSDEAFSINLGKKRVSWDDFIGHRSQRLTVPTDEVLDTLSGIYYLRNRQLQVGRNEILHIYDSETYAEVPVEILRREELRLPNLAKVATLVVHPLQKTAGIFRRTGAVLIWMTDDDHKVPVKIVTSIALGEVTAELVSAETEGPGSGKVPAGPVAALLRPALPGAAAGGRLPD
jgi:hypothetical protein